MLSKEALAELDQVFARYPTRRAAILPLLHLVQREHGHISAEAEEWVAKQLDLAPVKVHEVVTFYTMLKQERVGKYHLQVCRTLSCWLRGSGDLLGYLGEEHGLANGDVSADGRLSLEEVECLGACGNAPVVQVNEDYHMDMNRQKLAELLRTLK